MTVVDAIAELPVYNFVHSFGPAFDTLPLRNLYVAGDPNSGRKNPPRSPGSAMSNRSIFTASSGNPTVATVSVSDSNLLVTGKKTGTAKITATATDADGVRFDLVQRQRDRESGGPRATSNARSLEPRMACSSAVSLSGDAPKKVIIRALGLSPTLGGAGIPIFVDLNARNSRGQWSADRVQR